MPDSHSLLATVVGLVGVRHCQLAASWMPDDGTVERGSGAGVIGAHSLQQR